MTIYSFVVADDFLMGTAAEIFMLRSATNIFPTELITKGKFHSIGRILELIEVKSHARSPKLTLKLCPRLYKQSAYHFLLYIKVGYSG